MGKKIWKSLMFSLEWRIWAFMITTLFLWGTTGELAFAAAQAFGLQVILLAGHTLWYYLRSEGANAFTLDTLVTTLARYFYRSLMGRQN